MDTVGTAQFRMADKLAGGNLAALIKRYRAEGRSYEDITRQLFADHGIEASRQTVARWGAELESRAS